MKPSLSQLLAFGHKIIRFVGRNLIHNPRYFFTYTAHYLDPKYSFFPKMLSEEELTSALASGRSLVRLGDGEIYLMNHGGIHYQDYNPRLQEDILDMIRTYSDKSPYLLGVPHYLSLTNHELRTRMLLHCWLPFKAYFSLYFNKNAQYFDAHLFYRQGAFEQSLRDHLAHKHVICVGNGKVLDESLRTYLGTKSIKVDFIKVPERNAYKHKEDIIREIDAVLHETPPESLPVVLLAAGPASKTLAHLYALRNIQAIDIGHGIEILGRDMDYSHRI